MKRFLVIAAFCALAPVGASAQVVVTEIMYDLDGTDSRREWIEVFNAGSAPVALVDWRLFENGVNHKISSFSGGTILAAGGYAVVADNADTFKSNWPQYSGQLFDSAFSLGNEGETITLRDTKGVDIDSATFASAMGGSGDGGSLQREGAGIVFVVGMPTPGMGIPAGGLQKPPQKESKFKNNKSTPAAQTENPTIVGESSRESQVAAISLPVSTVSRTSLLWFVGPFLLALCGSSALVFSRHLKKDEWEIIEEIEETS